MFLEVLVKFRNADQFSLDEQFRILVSTDSGNTWKNSSNLMNLIGEKQIFDFDQYVGQSILVAFEYTDGDGFNIGAAIDDIAIGESLSFSQALDYILTVDGGAMFSECAENIDYEITGVVMNNGTDNITSFDLLVDSGTDVTPFLFNQISTQATFFDILFLNHLILELLHLAIPFR